LVAPFYFSYPIDRAVYEFKYRGRLSWGRFLASEMAGRVAAREEQLPELLIPIPIHRERLSARGFNQSLELARTIGSKLRIPVAPEALRRTDARSSLVGLNARQRERHVRGAFTTSVQEIKMRSIAIVDDILTTGATAREAARVLRRARVEVIEVWVGARTLF
jgi:ComF family protein